jgi:hypothetical protein
VNLDELKNLLVENETDRRRDRESRDDLEQGDAEVVEVVEERFFLGIKAIVSPRAAGCLLSQAEELFEYGLEHGRFERFGRREV